ncbi:MAG: pantoate--beta-alanine ligase, partial [Mariprofundaceae bacterium]|nr:pantoate--beta-alanine ligase [Mariprofundaceae bacterium]
RSYHMHIEYISINREHDLLPVQSFVAQEQTRIFIAAKIGSTRLIDNQAIPFIEDNPPCV